MKRVAILIVFLFPVYLFSLQLYQELAVGYYDDLGVSLGLRIEDPTLKIPFYLQARVGTAYQIEPGNAEDARKIFINDNTGGNIEEYGISYFVGLDFGWRLVLKEAIQVELNVSGLWNHYEAHFSFIGNNESFSVKTDALGLGVGGNLRIVFSEKKSSLLVKCGVEFYPKTQIDAHGTYYYTPDGTDDSPRNAYTYDDADESINQPWFRPYIQIGIIFPIG